MEASRSVPEPLRQIPNALTILRFLANHTLFLFVAYRVVLGVIVLALAGAGAID